MIKQSRIYIPVLLILVFTVLGCELEEMRRLVGDMETLSELGLRQVESAVIPVTSGGEEEKPPDLLILNRRLDPPPVEFYLSYVYKEEDRWEVRWEHNLGSDIVGDTDVTTLTDKARVYVIVGPTVQALKLSDGAVEWETSLSDEVAATCRECATLAKDRLVVLTSDLVLQGVNINSGEVEWSYEMKTSLGWQIRPIVLGQGDKVALVDQTDSDAAAPGVLQVFKAGDGEQLQSIAPQCSDIPFRVSSPVFIDQEGKNAYFTFSSGVTHCIQGWDIEGGSMLWEKTLPEEIIKAPSFFDNPHLDNPGLLTDDVLYYGFGGPAKKGKLININLSDGAINLLLEDPKYAITPLLKGDGILLLRASRTKGSEQDELWAVDIPSGEILWQHELKTTDLMGWGSNDSGVGTWTLAPVGGRLAVIQVISEGGGSDPYYVVVEILNTQDGMITAETKTLVDDGHWMGIASTKYRAYLSIRNLYSVSLETGKVVWEWPLSAPPPDLISQ
jgi:outer membrane protein assembly factor BamB